MPRKENNEIFKMNITNKKRLAAHSLSATPG